MSCDSVSASPRPCRANSAPSESGSRGGGRLAGRGGRRPIALRHREPLHCAPLPRPAHEPGGHRRPGRRPVAGSDAHPGRHARRPSGRLPGHPHHRDQRQGIGGPDGHGPAARVRSDRRHLHQPPPRGRQRTDYLGRRADQRRRAGSGHRWRGGRRGTGRGHAQLLRDPHCCGVHLLRRRGGRRGGGRGRDARSLRRHERGRRHGGRADQRGSGPHRWRGSLAPGHR